MLIESRGTDLGSRLPQDIRDLLCRLDVTGEDSAAAQDAFRRHGVSVRQLVTCITDEVGWDSIGDEAMRD